MRFDFGFILGIIQELLRYIDVITEVDGQEPSFPSQLMLRWRMRKLLTEKTSIVCSGHLFPQASTDSGADGCG
jgi:hypothetical protein